MFSNTTAELSLNAPSKCIKSIPNDTSNHRFLVGTCALSSSTSNSQSSFMDNGNGGHSYGRDNNNMNNNNNHPPSNSLYLLRYHEEMNELAVDAQLDFGDEEQSGEMWCLSSCPMDKTLLVSCRDNGNGNGSETALWRIPQKAMKEDEIDYYPDDIDPDHDINIDHGGGNGGVGGRNFNYSSDMNESMEKVDVLYHDLEGDERGAGSGAGFSRNCVLKGRVSDMKWNPECSPNADDGTGGGVGVGGINFLTVDHTIHGNQTMTTWDIGTSSVTSINRISIQSNDNMASSTATNCLIVPNPPKASWDPHNTNLCAMTAGLNVAIVDMRTGDVVSYLKKCHKFGVTDLDHNPNKPNVLSTCGQDSLVKFWDLRYSSSASTSASALAPTSSLLAPPSPSSSFEDTIGNLSIPAASSSSWTKQHPLRILRGGHTHWSTRVKYNSFHDQLLLSGGTDGMVNLWRVSSISSAPLLDLGSTADDDGGHDDVFDLTTSLDGFGSDDRNIKVSLNGDGDGDDLSFSGQNQNIDGNSFRDETDGGNAPDVRVTKMEMRDAVYDLDWSAADPWVYVTLSFDGNVVLNHVPSKEKYKILL
jgi:hypothetical protein